MKQFDNLRKYCETHGLQYDEFAEQYFSAFYEMLIERNKVMNLTAITEIAEVEQKHFIDSLASASIIRNCVDRMNSADECDKGPDSESGLSVIDIGTGAGFPGLPLSFVLRDMRFTLADSLAKRIGFIQDVIDGLQLPNVTAIHGRAEDLGRGDFRNGFDFCVSRAVAEISVLLEYCAPLVRKNGMVILYKSGDYEEELEKASYALEVLGAKVYDVDEFTLEDSGIRRSLIMIEKVSDTPEKYPRRAGKPAKDPLRA